MKQFENYGSPSIFPNALPALFWGVLEQTFAQPTAFRPCIDRMFRDQIKQYRYLLGVFQCVLLHAD